MRSRALVLLLSVLVPLGLTTGCSKDEPEPATGPGLPSQTELKAYFKAITSLDVDELARVQTEIAADGSLAQAYAAYDAEFASAAAAADQPGQPSEVEEVDGGFKACVGDSSDQCATWTDLHGKDGRLTDFDVNGTDLSNLLVDLTGQPPIESAGLYTVQPDHAYRQPKSGKLYVLCTVTASDVPLSPGRGTYIEGDMILDGVAAPSPETIDPGSSSTIILSFEDAHDVELDGQITFDLKLGDRATESIGFGLTAP